MLIFMNEAFDQIILEKNKYFWKPFLETYFQNLKKQFSPQKSLLLFLN